MVSTVRLYSPTAEANIADMKINVVTIFPEFFRATLATSILGRAAERGEVQYRIVDLRDFTRDRHRTVDDAPYGGGAGMVMKPEPFFEAVESLDRSGPIVLLSPRGKLFEHDDAVRISVQPDLTLLCGHYKDVDQRVADHLATEEISIGNFVLSGGEVAALAVTDAVVRLLPGVLGDHDSAASDSFYDGRLLSPAVLHPATRVPGPRGPRSAEEWRSQAHRRVAHRGRRASHKGAPARSPGRGSGCLILGLHSGNGAS